MTNVAQILSQIESGDPAAAEQLLPLVYDELRKLAAANLPFALSVQSAVLFAWRFGPDPDTEPRPSIATGRTHALVRVTAA